MPIYEIQIPSEGDHWTKFETKSKVDRHEDIAREYAELHDPGADWMFAEGDGEEIRVRLEGESEFKAFKVETETEIVYRVEEVF